MGLLQKKEDSSSTKNTLPTISLGFYCSFAVAAIGSLMLLWWTIAYHKANTHQWMVPMGLLLTGTPAIIWFSLFASDSGDSFDAQSLDVERQEALPDPEK
ncbi:hypothetical protein ACHQM5_000026 [Ranunculus cassubicifolius]